ncbi:hypothetical protein LXL04_002422 [Taraxacum kok-saghyz]
MRQREEAEKEDCQWHDYGRNNFWRRAEMDGNRSEMRMKEPIERRNIKKHQYSIKFYVILGSRVFSFSWRCGAPPSGGETALVEVCFQNHLYVEEDMEKRKSGCRLIGEFSTFQEVDQVRMNPDPMKSEEAPPLPHSSSPPKPSPPSSLPAGSTNLPASTSTTTRSTVEQGRRRFTRTPSRSESHAFTPGSPPRCCDSSRKSLYLSLARTLYLSLSLAEMATPPLSASSGPRTVDPSGRLGRYSDLLGAGAVKKVYRGFAQEEGRDVAWNQVKLRSFSGDPSVLKRLFESKSGQMEEAGTNGRSPVDKWKSQGQMDKSNHSSRSGENDFFGEKHESKPVTCKKEMIAKGFDLHHHSNHYHRLERPRHRKNDKQSEVDARSDRRCGRRWFLFGPHKSTHPHKSSVPLRSSQSSGYWNQKKGECFVSLNRRT